jgi:DNA-binding CsgD family transcriptional regulator
MTSASEFNDVVAGLRRCQSAYDVFKELRFITDTYGFENFLVINMPSLGSPAIPVRDLIILTNWRPELIHKCFDNTRFEDFVDFFSLDGSGTPICQDWRKYTGPKKTSNALNLISSMIELAHRAHVIVPVNGTRHHGRILLSGKRSIADNTELRDLFYLGTLAFDILLTVQADQQTEPNPLTEKEMECLVRLRAGQDFAEISDALGVTERTVSHYVSSAVKKLNASNKIHALSIAADRNWIG